ncbi:hypothetical protein HW132_01870 [Brasilonema sp. CT11]|nr:hypothetical protein [Brasilonema sp. CT11]
MKIDFVNSTLQTQKFAGKGLSIGASLPSNPGDKDLWFEPSYAPQPWEFDGGGANVWRSQPVTFDIAFPSNSGTFPLQISKVFPIGTTTLWLESYVAMLSPRAGTSNSSNYLTFTLQWTNTSGTATTLDTGDANGTGIGNYKRVSNNIYQYVTNPNQVLFIVNRIGTSVTSYQASLAFTYKFVRANS